MNPVVRALALHDAAEVETVCRRWHATAVDSYWYNDTLLGHTIGEARAFFHGHVLRDCALQVALVDGELAGMVALERPWIRQFAVFSEFRRAGVGSALLAAVRVLSPAELRLFTFQRNRAARAFYEHRGFRIEKLGVSPPPESEPDVEYRWNAALA